MLAYILVGLGSAAFTFAVRQFVRIPFLLTADAKYILLKYTPLKEGELSADAKELQASVLAHLDSMKDKSEIMIRHDAQVLRNKLSVGK